MAGVAPAGSLDAGGEGIGGGFRVEYNIADCRLQIADFTDCRLPIDDCSVDCGLDCRLTIGLSIVDCRLSIGVSIVDGRLN